MVLNYMTNKYEMTKQEYNDLKEKVEKDPTCIDEIMLDGKWDKKNSDAIFRKTCLENAEIID